MGIEFKTLEQFMPFWAQKILPAVYDDSLSYYQLLARILQKYNEVIEVVNKHSETLVDHENRITTNTQNIELNRQQIEALKVKLAELEEQVNTNTTNIEALTVRVNNHDEAIAALNNAISNITKYNRNNYATFDKNTHEIVLYREAGNTPETKYFDPIPFSEWGSAFAVGSRAYQLDVIDGTGSVSPGGIVVFCNRAFDSSNNNAFGFVKENGYLHYFTANYSHVGSDENHGATDNYSETELLDITNIKQSLGGGVYDTISQKILTEQLNTKLGTAMGITGASAGDFVKINEVDSSGKPVSYGAGTPTGGGGVDIVQTTGQSISSVMSQKAVTDNLENIQESIGQVGNNFNDISTAANATIKYPSTAGGTDGAFLGYNGMQTKQYIRAELLSTFFGQTGANKIFSVQKTGTTSFDRIAWFKSTAGEGLYDFAWYETDGTSARAGVDRLTMNAAGNFAVSNEKSINLMGGGGSADFTIISGEVCDFAASVFTTATSREYALSTTLGSTPIEVITALHSISRPAVQLQQSDNTTAGVQTVVLTPSYNAIPTSVSNGNRFDLYTGAIRGVNSQGSMDYAQIYCTILIKKDVAKLEINYRRTVV